MERKSFMAMLRNSVQISMVIGLLLFFSFLIAPSGALFAQEKTAVQEKPPGKEMLASELIDQAIYSPQNNQIGEIDDLAIKRNGKIKRVIVDTGGFLRFGEEQIGIPFTKLQIGNDGKIVLNMTRDEIEKMPEFNYARYGLRRDYYYRPYSGYAPYYYTPYGFPGYEYRPPHRRNHSMRNPPNPHPGFNEWYYYPPYYLASIIMDFPVFNYQTYDIGILRDLVINDKGHIDRIIVSRNNGIFEKKFYVSLPYRPLGFTSYGLVYDVTAEEVKQAPEYPYKKEKK
jgi:sporulation protein YlmC with PRC-barrel domain